MRALDRRRPAAADDKLQIAQIDEHAERLPDDEHRVLAIERVAEQHQAAADREHPERGRHHTAPGPLRGDPLYHEAHGEHPLRDVTDQDAPIGIADEHLVQIAADGARDIDQHLSLLPSVARDLVRKPVPTVRDRALVLYDFRNTFLTADQPPHAGQIEDADPEPVPHPVVRYAGAAWAVHHVDIANRITFALDQRR